MTITEKDIRAIIKGMYDKTPGYITYEGARILCGWLYNTFGLSITSLYLHDVWNEFAVDDNKQSC